MTLVDKNRRTFASFFCDECSARAGQRCFSRNRKVYGRYHKSRRDKAAEWNSRCGQIG